MNAHGRALLLLCSLWLPLCGCGRPGQGEEDVTSREEWPARALTIWTDRHEYFIEHDIPVPSRESGFAVHVTTLADGSPRTECPLVMVFRSQSATVEVPLSAPDRPGIYLADVALPSVGIWDWTLEVDGDRPELPPVSAVEDEQTAQRVAAALQEPEGSVTMLKEQQWPIRLRVERVSVAALEEGLPATARILPAPTHAAWVVAPAGGQLMPLPGRQVVGLGESIQAGELLALFRIPILGGDLAGWENAGLQRRSAKAEASHRNSQAAADVQRAHAEVTRAESEFERVKGLHATQAKSTRELEEARYRMAAARASLEAAEGALRTWREALARLAEEGGGSHDPAAAHLELELRAPVTGAIVSAPHAAGQWLEEGERLFHVLDDGLLRLALRVPEADLHRLADRPRGRLRSPLDGAWLEFPGPEGRVLIAAPGIDPDTRAGEVIFEIPNPGWLRSGMTLEALLASGAARTGIAIPSTALVDDDGLSVVYVQTAGETFARRPVRTGIRDGDRVEILEGLEPGERVVVEGAYVVRLVSLSGAIPEHKH